MFKFIQEKGRSWVLLGLICWAILSVGRAMSKNAGTGGSLDFHSFWFYGHFVWQGTNPYDAFVQGKDPTLPIHYWDGETITQLPVAQTGLGKTPTNTAPMVLLLSFFSRWSWDVAKWGWFICNLLAMVAVPWIALQTISPKLSPWLQTAVVFGFVGLTSTRVGLWIGQTSLWVVGLMILSVFWMDKKPVVAGILLGIALSKYSVALPVLLLFLYYRCWWATGISLGLQLIAFVAISLLDGGGIAATWQAHQYILQHHLVVTGIHWGYWLSAWPSLEWLLMGFGTLALFLFLWRTHSSTNLDSKWGLLTILSLWVLLIAYHGVYDAVLVIIYGVWVLAIGQKEVWSGKQWGLFLLPLVASFLPGEIISAKVPAWAEITNLSLTLSLQMMLFLAMGIVYRQQQIKTA